MTADQTPAGAQGAETPAWVRELAISLPIYPQIILTGNVRDIYMLPVTGGGAGLAPYSLTEVLEGACRDRGYGGLLIHDAITGALVPWELSDGFGGFPSSAIEAPGDVRQASREDEPEAAEVSLQRVLVDVVNHRGAAIGLIVPYAASIGPRSDDEEGARRYLYRVVEALADSAQPVPGRDPVMPYNTLFWITERQDKLPAEFPVGNKAIHIITIPAPPIEQRLAAARVAVQGLEGTDGEEAETAAARVLALETHGMHNTELLAIGRMAVDRAIPADRLKEAARLYRIGVTDNPWAASALRKSIADGEAYLNARVIGQDRAVRKTMEIFRRSAAGLTGAQSASSPNRPRGVLFLAGPTGVGKTELAKGIATMIFGSDSRPVRFDMSEFGEEHSRDRLIGAPPGYVGHHAGGELTNALRENPMSVLLFDEIDKANPGLFDLFLQILEDGRLTDGRGATVYFTECILIFTSNLGVVTLQPDGTPRHLKWTDPPEEVRDSLRKSFNLFFDTRIGRPELRNRFGDSFIALDFIQPESVPAILDKALNSVCGRVAEVHGATVVVSEDARAVLREASITKLEHGGRGVNNVVEMALVNPLSAEIFEGGAAKGETITVESIAPDGDFWQVKVSRCSA
ncbi:MAG TPA: AAA family ATPase [Streptosporangiaceae bacterium]|nr:AAA family ATPase [Streptosporangiaceae bacterium]